MQSTEDSLSSSQSNCCNTKFQSWHYLLTQKSLRALYKLQNLKPQAWSLRSCTICPHTSLPLWPHLLYSMSHSLGSSHTGCFDVPLTSLNPEPSHILFLLIKYTYPHQDISSRSLLKFLFSDVFSCGIFPLWHPSVFLHSINHNVTNS